MTDVLEKYRDWADKQDSYDPESWDLMIHMADEIERLRALLKEGLEVADDLIEKTDVYLGINEAYDRHDKWEKQASEALGGSDATV